MSDLKKMSKGRSAWKGVEHAQNAPEFTQWVGDEFPHRKDLKNLDRRDFLKLTAGSLALAGLASGCRLLPQTKIVPFVQQPEDLAVGEFTWYATTNSLSGYSTGLLAASYEGRPIKIEGNAKHPASGGGCSAIDMAETMSLYDPDRHKIGEFRGSPRRWQDFLDDLRAGIQASVEAGGPIIVLSEIVSSPTLAGQIQNFVDSVPGAAWHQVEPVNREYVETGAKQAFGKDVHTYFDFTKADVILAVDSDLMQISPAPVRYARDIMAGRDVEHNGGKMNRIYAVESRPTLIGANADHRIPLKPSLIAAFVRALASRLGVISGSASLPEGVDAKWMDALVHDLEAAPGRAVVAVGDQQNPTVHGMVHAINEKLGAHGGPVVLTDPVLPQQTDQAGAYQAFRGFTTQGGKALLSSATILVLGGNPVFTTPEDWKLGSTFSSAKFSAHLTMHKNETSEMCNWVMPMSHFLEAWSDGVAYDGTASIAQPLIEPMYETKSAIELMEAVNSTHRSGEEAVKAYWSENKPGGAVAIPAAAAEGAPEPAPQADPGDSEPQLKGGVMLSEFDIFWKNVLASGTVPDSAAESIEASVVSGYADSIEAPPTNSGLEVLFLPDPTIYDGRYANNPWLQELPKPITNFTWDNAIYLSPATAEKLDLRRKELFGSPDVVNYAIGYGRTMASMSYGGGGSIKMPVAENIGQADDTVILHMGYGRTKGGANGTAGDPEKGGGFNVYPFRSNVNASIYGGIQLEKAEGLYEVANVQFHNALESSKIDSGRHVIQEATLEDFLHGGDGHGEDDGHGGEDDHGSDKPPSLYDASEHDHSEDNYQWAMTIDLNLCTGCNACTLACQSENNIPSVGKYQVQRGREMHWIRIDRYYMGDYDGGKEEKLDTHNPDVRFQPVTCMQCENAPCEPVCPVAATVHSKEGINQMVYNRCVGTRYCSNNCPYKVRRFNFLHYTLQTDEVPVLRLLQNPDVTVRSRGVMEKCTYCVQRINRVRVNSKKAGEAIKDGEIVTACEAACPTNAITFGDMRDPESKVYKRRHSKRNYALLEETNTVPRTTYLMKVTNPNPDLAGNGGEKHV